MPNADSAEKDWLVQTANAEVIVKAERARRRLSGALEFYTGAELVARFEFWSRYAIHQNIVHVIRGNPPTPSARYA